MKQLRLLLAILLFVAGCAVQPDAHRYHDATDDSNTVNPLPVAGTSSFASSTITFLAKEDANRWLEDGFGNFIVSGCIGATAPGLVLTPSACIAYNAGYRSTEAGAITFPNNSTCWVAMDENTSGSNPNLTNFTRAGVTHYLFDCIDGAQPAMPNDAQLIMRVTTSGGAVTAVDNSYRVTTPNFALNLATLKQNLNANGFRITGLGANTTNGDALSQGLSHLNDLATATADYNMGGFDLSNLEAGATSGDSLAFGLNHLNDLATATGNYSMGAGNALLYPGSGSGTVTTKAQAAAGTWTFQWPANAGTNLFVLQTDGTGITSWVTPPGGPPTGAAGGDLAGTYPNPTVAKVNTNAVSATAPTNAQVWVENAGATSMVPVSISGDCTIAATGAITCTKINGVTPGGTCTNQFASAISASGVPTCSSPVLAGAQFANQGTTTTVAHGNAAGNPSWAGVDLVNDPTANQGTTTTVYHGNGAGQPSFGKVALGTDVSGTLPTVSGGTGNAVGPANEVPYIDGCTTATVSGVATINGVIPANTVNGDMLAACVNAAATPSAIAVCPAGWATAGAPAIHGNVFTIFCTRTASSDTPGNTYAFAWTGNAFGEITVWSIHGLVNNALIGAVTNYGTSAASTSTGSTSAQSAATAASVNSFYLTCAANSVGSTPLLTQLGGPYQTCQGAAFFAWDGAMRVGPTGETAYQAINAAIGFWEASAATWTWGTIGVN